MLFDHDEQVDRSDSANPVYRFSVDVDAEFLRERLLERGAQAGPLEVDYAVRRVWDELLGSAEEVLDEVVSDMPSVDDSWDLLDELRTTHTVYDEEGFWLAIEEHPEMWNPPSTRTKGWLSTRSERVARAIREHAGEYPGFTLEESRDFGLVCKWEDFLFLNECLASLVGERFEERFGKEIRVDALSSEFTFHVLGSELGKLRGECQTHLGDLREGRLRPDLEGSVDEGRLAELVAFLGAILSVDGAAEVEFMVNGEHIPELENGSNTPEHILVMRDLNIGVPDDPDIPF